MEKENRNMYLKGCIKNMKYSEWTSLFSSSIKFHNIYCKEVLENVYNN